MFTSNLLCFLAVPSAIQPIQNVNITEGRNLTLFCNVSGNPMVSWIKVGDDVSTSGSELVFTNISRTQAGEYMCEASNLCGNASETASIEVQCKLNCIIYTCVIVHCILLNWSDYNVLLCCKVIYYW